MTFNIKSNKKLLGFVSGVINGLLGAGGGMIVVPALKTELSAKQAHATAVAVIFPMCLSSSVMYLHSGRVTLGDALPFIPYGLIGAFIGTALLTKLNAKQLKTIFSLFMIWAGVRLIIR